MKTKLLLLALAAAFINLAHASDNAGLLFTSSQGPYQLQSAPGLYTSTQPPYQMAGSTQPAALMTSVQAPYQVAAPLALTSVQYPYKVAPSAPGLTTDGGGWMLMTAVPAAPPPAPAVPVHFTDEMLLQLLATGSLTGDAGDDE